MHRTGNQGVEVRLPLTPLFLVTHLRNLCFLILYVDSSGLEALVPEWQMLLPEDKVRVPLNLTL